MIDLPDEIQERIAAYVDGELSPADAARLEVYLANTDPGLADMVVGMLANRVAVRAMPRPMAPADLSARVMESIERGSLMHNVEEIVAPRRPRWQSRAAIAAGLVVVLGGFSYFVASSVFRPATDPTRNVVSTPSDPSHQIAMGTNSSVPAAPAAFAGGDLSKNGGSRAGGTATIAAAAPPAVPALPTTNDNMIANGGPALAAEAARIARTAASNAEDIGQQQQELNNTIGGNPQIASAQPKVGPNQQLIDSAIAPAGATPPEPRTQIAQTSEITGGTLPDPAAGRAAGGRGRGAAAGAGGAGGGGFGGGGGGGAGARGGGGGGGAGGAGGFGGAGGGAGGAAVGGRGGRGGAGGGGRGAAVAGGGAAVPGATATTGIAGNAVAMDTQSTQSIPTDDPTRALAAVSRTGKGPLVLTLMAKDDQDFNKLAIALSDFVNENAGRRNNDAARVLQQGVSEQQTQINGGNLTTTNGALTIGNSAAGQFSNQSLTQNSQFNQATQFGGQNGNYVYNNGISTVTVNTSGGVILNNFTAVNTAANNIGLQNSGTLYRDQNFNSNNDLRSNFAQALQQAAAHGGPYRATLTQAQLEQLFKAYRVTLLARGDEVHIFRVTGDKAPAAADTKDRADILRRAGVDAAQTEAANYAATTATAQAGSGTITIAPAVPARVDTAAYDCVILMEAAPAAAK